MINFLEEISMNAWPAFRQVVDDGWVLRSAQGYTRRANSVIPLSPGTGDIEAKIVRCEAFYRQQGLPAIFKLTPAESQLDDLLAARQYEQQAMTSVQVLPLAKLELPATPAVTIFTEPTPAWLTASGLLHASTLALRGLDQRILENICHPTCLALVMDGPTPVVVGLGVLERHYVGLFGIITDPAHRRRGFARQIITAILHWAREHGATHAYLQVMHDNAPALALYAKLGFVPQYSYWYRVKRV